jgi:hypothetical protein
LSKTFLHFGATNRAVLLKLINAVISGSLLEEGRAILRVSCNLRISVSFFVFDVDIADLAAHLIITGVINDF